MKYKVLNWSFYTVCFLVFSFIGWLYELGWEIYLGNGFVNRGFLYGFYLPIYGFGGLVLLLCLSGLMSKKLSLWKINMTPVIVFVAIVVISSAIEYLAGWAIEEVLHTRLWDYSTTPFNLHGRIALKNSIFFGIGGMFYLYLVYPLLKKMLANVGQGKLKIIAVIIIAVFVVDLVTVILL